MLHLLWIFFVFGITVELLSLELRGSRIRVICHLLVFIVVFWKVRTVVSCFNFWQVLYVYFIEFGIVLISRIISIEFLTRIWVSTIIYLRKSAIILRLVLRGTISVQSWMLHAFLVALVHVWVVCTSLRWRYGLTTNICWLILQSGAIFDRRCTSRLNRWPERLLKAKFVFNFNLLLPWALIDYWDNSNIFNFRLCEVKFHAALIHMLEPQLLGLFVRLLPIEFGTLKYLIV